MSKKGPCLDPAGPALTHPLSFLSPQGGGSGEEQLCADFPELDLSQLDASDFDSATCFGELQWCPENAETEPSQYSPDDAELFQVCPLSLEVSLFLKGSPCTASSAFAPAKKSHHPTAPGTLPLIWDLPLIWEGSHLLAGPVTTSAQGGLGRAALAMPLQSGRSPPNPETSLPCIISLTSHPYPVRQAR